MQIKFNQKKRYFKKAGFSRRKELIRQQNTFDNFDSTNLFKFKNKKINKCIIFNITLFFIKINQQRGIFIWIFK